MQQFIINTKATYIKNILLTDSKVRLSDEDYKTLEAFNTELDSDKKGLLNTQHTFEYTAIQKIVPFKEDLGFQVFFTEKGKNEKAYLDFKTDEAGAAMQIIVYPGADDDKVTIVNVQNFDLTFIATTLTNYFVKGYVMSTDTQTAFGDIS